MTRFNITNDIYEMIAERCNDTFWDCIELANGFAVVFACKNGKPYDVEVFDEDDNELEHDFNLTRFEALAA